MKTDFWKTKPLAAMSPAEWEALCDRCGLCCLEKLEDPQSGDIYLTSIACQFYEITGCQCLIYEHRHRLNPDCVELTPSGLRHLTWLPDSCAYRRLANGQDLPAWHRLVCGDPEAVHESGISVRNKAVCGRYADPADRQSAVIGPPLAKRE
jgi:uncharacterized cysteine cluster protein YcgN (CxxCxxCC family)